MGSGRVSARIAEPPRRRGLRSAAIHAARQPASAVYVQTVAAVRPRAPDAIGCSVGRCRCGQIHGTRAVALLVLTAGLQRGAVRVVPPRASAYQSPVRKVTRGVSESGVSSCSFPAQQNCLHFLRSALRSNLCALQLTLFVCRALCYHYACAWCGVPYGCCVYVCVRVSYSRLCVVTLFLPAQFYAPLRACCSPNGFEFVCIRLLRVLSSVALRCPVYRVLCLYPVLSIRRLIPPPPFCIPSRADSLSISNSRFFAFARVPPHRTNSGCFVRHRTRCSDALTLCTTALLIDD